MPQPDLRVYATVFYSDHSMQYYSTVIVNVISTPISLLSLYLILKHSKHERFVYKLCLFVSQLSIFCAELQMGVIAGLVTLHPFPAVYCQGFLSEYFSAFTLFMAWCFIFCIYGYSTFIMVLTRLQIVARRGRTFDVLLLNILCKQKYYSIAYFFLALFVFVPVPGLMATSYATREKMEEFVRTRFPNNLKVLEHSGIHIFTELEKTEIVQLVMIFTVVGGFLYLLIMHLLIYRETRVNEIQRSNRHIKEHLKSLYKMIVQTIFIAVFLTTSCLLIMKSFFNDPTVDSRISNTIAYSCLCAGSIPSQIMMISRNTAYKNFVLRRKTSRASNQQRRRSTIVAT